MDDKIKISIPKMVLDLLHKDCVDFKVCKENGEPNFNLFINKLICNFCREFCAAEESLHTDIQTAIDDVPERYKEKVFTNVLKLLSKRTEEVENRDTVTFSFKTTKLSENARFYIQNVILPIQSQSSFYRKMLVVYSGKPKNEREKIIYKEHYDVLQKALKKNLLVSIQLDSGVLAGVSLHSVHSSKDELFNYVLLFNNKQNVTLRLSSIRNVTVLTTPACIPDKNVAMFDRQVVCSVQYPIYSTDDEPIKVKLSPKGKQLFDKIYLYRPTPVSIDGDVYTFNCSGNQLLYYFERFGEHALILEPKRLGVFMRNYYYYALKKYRTLYSAD